MTCYRFIFYYFYIFNNGKKYTIFAEQVNDLRILCLFFIIVILTDGRLTGPIFQRIQKVQLFIWKPCSNYIKETILCPKFPHRPLFDEYFDNQKYMYFWAKLEWKKVQIIWNAPSTVSSFYTQLRIKVYKALQTTWKVPG